jgi:hypothetical protein
LEELLPNLTEEMMLGRVESDKQDRVILHINLPKEKTNWLKRWQQEYHGRQSPRMDNAHPVSLVA